MIVYKVVHKDHRYGTNLIIFLQQNLISYQEFLKDTEEEYREYFPLYLKDSILEAPKDSLGFLLFKRKIDALAFIKFEFNYKIRNDAMILRIETLGKTKKIQSLKLRAGCGSHPEDIYKYHTSILDYRYHAPLGTIGCHKIKVLN